MRKRIFVVFVIACLLLCTCGYAKPRIAENWNVRAQAAVQTLTTSEKVADFEYMYKILKENYPYFKVEIRESGYNWLAHKDEFMQEIENTKDDNDFFAVLQQILQNLQNGHAGMLSADEYDMDKAVYQKYVYTAWLDQFNNQKAIARYSSMNSNIDSSGGQNLVFTGNVKHAVLDKGKIAYLAIHSLNSFNITPDMKIIKPFLASIKKTKAIIIDIRKNGGGDSAYWSDNLVPMLINHTYFCEDYDAYRGGSFCEPFIKQEFGASYKDLRPVSDILYLKNIPPEIKTDFKYYTERQTNISPKDSINYKGKIYLLVDNGVFSSAEMFAAFCKSSKFATIVGTRTGGDGIGFDPAVCVLPNSGYLFRFPQMMGLTSDGTCNFEYGTKPDISVSTTINVDLSKDVAVNKIIALCQ